MTAAKAPRVRAAGQAVSQKPVVKRPALKRPAAQKSAPAKAAAVAPSVRPTKPAKPAKAPKAPKVVKPAKLRQKPVRDSFTMPEADFALIAALKGRLLAAKRETKKSELLRAGLHALAALETPALLAALGALAPVKVGRPKSGH